MLSSLRLTQRIHTITKQFPKCSDCQNYRKMISNEFNNITTERCIMFLRVNKISTPLNDQQIKLKSNDYINSNRTVCSIEPEFARTARLDEMKCGPTGKYFWNKIE